MEQNNSKPHKPTGLKYSRCCFQKIIPGKIYDCSYCEKRKRKLEKEKLGYPNFKWDSKVVIPLNNKNSNLKNYNLAKKLKKENHVQILQSSKIASSIISPKQRKSSRESISYLSLRNETIPVPDSSNNWEMQLNFWFSKGVSKFDLYLISVFVGKPIRQANIKEKKILLEDIGTLLKPRAKVVGKKYVQLYSNLADELLCLADNCYFHFINPFFPLFTQKSFSSHPRSNLLRSVVWRVGLEYLPPSLLKTSLICSIEDSLQSLLKPSLLPPTLDTMQSITIFFYLVYTPSLSRTKMSLLAYISSLFYALGLHDSVSAFKFINKKNRHLFFERQLVINQLYIIGAVSFFKEELPLVKPKHQISFQCIELAYSKHSSLKYESIHHMHEGIFSDIKLKCERKIEDFEQKKGYKDDNFESTMNFHKLDIVSSTLDLAVLAYEYFFQEFSKILQKLKAESSYINQEPEFADSYIKLLSQAEKRFDRMFLAGFSFYNKLKTICIPSTEAKHGSNSQGQCFVFNSTLVSKFTTLFETFNCFSNINICQMQLILCIQYHFHRLGIMRYLSYIDFSISPPKISKKLSNDKVSLAASKGIFSAVKLINLVAMISCENDFLCKRAFLITSATNFIFQFLKVYSSVPDPSLFSMFDFPKDSIDPKIIRDILISALQKARLVLIKLSSNPITKFTNESGLALIDLSMRKHNISVLNY